MSEPVPAYDKVVAGNITAARARRRLSQKEVAARMEALGFGWRQQIVTAAESGRRRITVAELLGLALALETSIGVLLEPSADQGQVMLPSGQSIDAACVAWSVRHFNDRSVVWNGDTPEFRDIPESRRVRDIQDAAIGPMGRYARYIPDIPENAPTKSPAWGAEIYANQGPSAGDLDDWEIAAAEAPKQEPEDGAGDDDC